jgi:tetratricopeptide (TPR) repeat protein
VRLEDLAKYSKKRARDLEKDAFRDKTMGIMDDLGHRFEGQGRNILYAIGALVLIGLVVWGFMAWRDKKNDEARLALGRAIEISQSPISATPVPNSTGPIFSNEQERAQRSVEEFQKVAGKYSGQTRELANYFIATNLLSYDREKGISQLQSLTNSGDSDVAARSKFALAMAYESDGKLDQALSLYHQLAEKPTETVPADSANLRAALVLEKQGKQKEAADILFNIVSNARKAEDKDKRPIPMSGAAQAAETELEKLDPARFAELPAKPAALGFPA